MPALPRSSVRLMNSTLMLNVPPFNLVAGQCSLLRSDEAMDLELPPPCLKFDAAFMFNDAVNSFSDNMQGSVRLMRLHSAPRSMLADPVDTAGDEFLSTGSSPLAQAAVDAEFARFFPDDISCHASQFESKGVLHQISKSRALRNGVVVESAVKGEQQIGDRSGLISQHALFNRAAANGVVEDASRAPLSSILEHRAEVSSENFYGNSQIPLSLCRQQGALAVVSVASDSGIPCFTSLPQSEMNLARHSSSPAGLVSLLTTEAQDENIEPYAGSMMRSLSDCLPERSTTTKPITSVPMKNCFEAVRGPGMNSHNLVASSSTKIELLRQSSSPAGLLSQLNLDGLGDAEKLVLPSSSGNSSEEGTFDKRGGLPFLPSFPWDESVAAPGRVTVESSNGVSSAARKRIRELKYFPGSTLTDTQRGDALEHIASANHFGWPTATNPEAPYCPDKLPSDSVLCRARAKRGFATHPRSIAERVRRTKISERMRKLQELVPNMDKQTNTADMLDEAVEYVKLLQRQVQELTEKQPKCDGSCKQKTTSSK